MCKLYAVAFSLSKDIKFEKVKQIFFLSFVDNPVIWTDFKNRVSPNKKLCRINIVCYYYRVSLYIIPIVNVRRSGHIKINAGPSAYKNQCWTDMTRLMSQAIQFILNPLCTKQIRPKLCQFDVRATWTILMV